MDPRVLCTILGTVLFAAFASPYAAAFLAPFHNYVSLGVRTIAFMCTFYAFMQWF